MNTLMCNQVRSQLMVYIDNELSDHDKKPLVDHLEKCPSCIEYLNNEKELKSKICSKLKSAYICKCNVEKLASDIKKKINEFCTNKNSE